MNKHYQNALLKNADGEMADDNFQEVKKMTKGRIEQLEKRLNDLAVVGSMCRNIQIYLKKLTKNRSNYLWLLLFIQKIIISKFG